MPTTFSTNGAVGKRTFGRGRGAPTGSIETTFRESKNLRDRNRSLDSEFQKNNEYFDKWYDSQSGDEGSIPTRSNYKTYPYDYFTGTNARIFFGDVWVDDIISINYSASQTKEPIYGYASQTFDAVARGVVTVQGSFSIAFKEMGYLNIIQRLLEKQRQGASAALDHKLDEIAEKASAGKAAYEPRLASEQFTGQFGFSPTGQPQIIREQDTIEDILAFKKNGNIIASRLGAATSSSSKADRDFEDFAELMEDTIWGDSNGNPLNRNFQFRRVDEFDYRYDSSGKDIGGIITSKTKYGDDYSSVLNILLTFGDLNDVRAEHTLVVLNDVHLLGESMIVAPTGEPIAVNYNFFARNINQTITKNLAQNIDPIKFEVGVDYEVSKIDDIEKIEGKLLDQEKPTRFEVEAIAKFRELDGWASIQPPDVLGIVQEEVVNDKVIKLISRNPWEPVIDQVIKVVEGSVNNELAAWAVDTTYSQYVVKVKMTNSAGNLVTGNDITMVLEQRIPNTHTYRVISPTRQNFRAPQVFTRDDLWATIKPPKNPGEKEPNPNVRNAGDTATVSTLKGKLYTTDAFGNKIEVPLDELGTPIDVNPLDKTEGLSSFPTGEATIIAEARADELGLTGVDRELFIAQEELRALEEQERRNAQTNTSSSTTSTPTGRDTITEQEQQYLSQSEAALAEADNLGLTGEEREQFITDKLYINASERALEEANRQNLTGKERERFITSELEPFTSNPSTESVKEKYFSDTAKLRRAEEVLAEADNLGLTGTEREVFVTDKLYTSALEARTEAFKEDPTLEPSEIEDIVAIGRENIPYELWKEYNKLAPLIDNPVAKGAIQANITTQYSKESPAETEALIRVINTNEELQEYMKKETPELFEFYTSESAQEQYRQYRQEVQEKGRELTREKEGAVQEVYTDSINKQTIGVGFNIDPSEPTSIDTVQRSLGVTRNEAENIITSWRSGTPITEEQQEAIFLTQYETAQREIRELVPNIEQLSPATEAALTDLAFNIGRPRTETFEKAIAAARAGDEEQVKYELLSSKREIQTGGRGTEFYLKLGLPNSDETPF